MRCSPSIVLPLCAFALLGTAACAGGQSTDDFGGDPGDRPLEPCSSTRSVLAEPDAAARRALDWIEGRYPLAARWGAPPAVVDYDPSDRDVTGELEVRYQGGEIARVEGCTSGTEIAVRISLHTDDGGLREEFPATVLVPPGAERWVEVRAELDLGSLAGDFTVTRDGDWTLRTALLTAELTGWGSRGRIAAFPVRARADEPALGATMSWTSPAADPLLIWPAAPAACGQLGDSFEPVGAERSAELERRRAEANMSTHAAVFDDGTEVDVSIQVGELQAVCVDGGLTRLPTGARITTSDGRLDLTIDVAVDPDFAPWHWNNRTDRPWAFPPEAFVARVGRAPVALTGFAHAGVEAWLTQAADGEARGWVKLLGYHSNDCQVCDAIGCIECAYDARTELLELTIGEP